MVLFNSIRILFLAIISVAHAFNMEVDKNYETCKKITKNPYFESEMVAGKSWRIYYSWNINLEDKCLDMSFTNSSQAIVSRIYSDMYEYLESQPYWDAATLLVSMGQAHHEMLLLADQGGAGSFVGVPNVVRDGNITPNKHGVPLFKIHMKVLYNGKFLVMSDCNIGVSTLSLRRDQKLSRTEVMSAVNDLGLGSGNPACLSDKSEDANVDNSEPRPFLLF